MSTPKKPKGDNSKLLAALAVLRDPDGTGRTKVSHGFSNEPLRPVPCMKGGCRLATGHDGEHDARVKS